MESSTTANVSIYYSSDSVKWQQYYTEKVVVPGVLTEENSIGLSASFNALTTAPGTAYVEYDYVKIFKAEIKAKDPAHPNMLLPVDDSFKPLLGQRWTFVAIGPDGQTHLNANWTVTSDTSTMTAAKNALFPETVGIFFDSSTITSEKEFQIVHLGTATISISDPVTKQLLAMKKINVKPPHNLGDPVRLKNIFTKYDPMQFDPLIIINADRFGIPPQLIKGQIEQESWPPFNPNTYRYEIPYDYKNVSVRNIRNSDACVHYKMEYSKNGMSYLRGDRLLEIDVNQRNILKY